jgi:hypothetical protein
MKRLARLLIRLYPANWQVRYGQELEALVEDSSAGWTAIFDLLKGAIRMQLSVPSLLKLALAWSITGLLMGLLISALVAPIYVSEATLEVIGGNGNLFEHVMQCEQQVVSKASLTSIIQNPYVDLYREERARAPVEDIIERMRKSIVISPEAAAASHPMRLPFLIRFTYLDRAKAQQTVRALTANFIEANMAGAIHYGRAGVTMRLIAPANFPLRATHPREAFMIEGFRAGLLAAMVIAIFRRKPPATPLPAKTA